MRRKINNQRGVSALVVGASVFAVVVVVAAAVWLFASKKETPIKIGSIISLSGSSSHLVDLKDGMILAADEINTAGGVNGKKIELIIEDSKTDLEEGKKAFARIEAAHQPLLYVSTNSFISMALSPLAERHRVPLIGLVTSAPEFTAQKEWTYRYWMTSNDEIPPVLVWLNRLNVNQLGVLFLDDPFGRSVYVLLQKACEEIGKTVKAQGYKKNISDLGVQIGALMDMEAIYIVGYVKHIGAAVKHLKKVKYKGKIISASGATNERVKKLPEANGIYVAAPAFYNPGYVYATEAKSKYEAKFGKPLNHQAANGYDFVKLLASLLEDKEMTRAGVKRLLEAGFTYAGVFGTLNLKPGARDIPIPLFPAKIVDGELVYR
jgi:branched-chain amino acid transport system substrate-binding protein